MEEERSKTINKTAGEAKDKSVNKPTDQATDQTAMDVIWLAGCSVRGEIPARDRIGQMDLQSVYALAGRHLLGAAVATALESAGIRDQNTRKAIGSAMRKTVLFDQSWQEISARLEEAGIWYMPLKGAVLKNYYPGYGMREFADHDILFDSGRAEDVRAIMEDLGFSVEKYGRSAHDVYHKPPVLNFEMHRELFGPGPNQMLHRYYEKVGDRLLRGDGCERRFTPEDFYVYLTAHEYKHYSQSGTGLRSLLDTYVYLQRKWPGADSTDAEDPGRTPEPDDIAAETGKPDTDRQNAEKPGRSLDLDYIAAETRKLGIDAFERQNRSLSLHLFGGEQLTEEDRIMLEYILSSGTYGNLQNRIRNTMIRNGWGKARYALARLIGPISKKNPDYEAYARVYPFFYKYKIFMPFLPFYRIYRGMKIGRFQAEVKTIRNLDRDRK